MVRVRTSLMVVSAGLSFLALPGLASGQCCCHGGGGGSNSQLIQMLLTQMQTQQVMQQLQSQQVQLQQIQQKLNELVKEMAAKDADALAAALGDARPEVRWAAARAIAMRQLPLQDALIARLTDPHLDVRQAARGALIQLSATQMAKTSPGSTAARKPRSNPGVDFGPAPAASRSAQAQAARKWSQWWAKQTATEVSRLGAR